METIRTITDSSQSELAQIRNLQIECEKLRIALAESEMQRNAYRSLFIDELRSKREFEDLDISSLEAISAGPVEFIKEE